MIKVNSKPPDVRWTFSGSVSPMVVQTIDDAYRKAYEGFVEVEPLVEEE